MAHLSLYRKHRSQTFADLVGQPHVVRTLQSAIASGRISHAYLFTGPRGTGKTSTARLLAKAVCCEKGPLPEPCNACELCRAITAGNCMDVLEMDAASESGVEQVRETIVRIAEYLPTQCRYRVIIVDEVHDLSAKAFDALLKTIEEPPGHVIFVLATTEYSKVPLTIRSRCQKFEFHRGTIPDISDCLARVAAAENAQIEPSALATIARMADGAYRDALNLLEQLILVSEGPIRVEQVYEQLGLLDDQSVDDLLSAMAHQDVSVIVAALGEFLRLGRDPRAIIESLLYRLSDLTHACYGTRAPGNDETALAAMRGAVARIGRENVLALRAGVADALRAVRDITLPRIWLESELIRLSLSLAAAPRTDASAPPPEPGPRDSRKRIPPQAQQPAAPAASSSPEPRTTVESPATDEKSEVPTQDNETADPALRRAREVWEQVVRAIEGASKGKAIGRKLLGTRVVAFKEGVIQIEFERQIDRDGVLEGPNAPGRIAKINEYLRALSGEPWRAEFLVADRPSNGTPTAAVELPLEGQRLLEMTREVFPGGGA